MKYSTILKKVIVIIQYSFPHREKVRPVIVVAHIFNAYSPTAINILKEAWAAMPRLYG